MPCAVPGQVTLSHLVFCPVLPDLSTKMRPPSARGPCTKKATRGRHTLLADYKHGCLTACVGMQQRGMVKTGQAPDAELAQTRPPSTSMQGEVLGGQQQQSW